MKKTMTMREYLSGDWIRQNRGKAKMEEWDQVLAKEEKREIEVGDWIRFYRNGRLVIEEIAYIKKQLSSYNLYCNVRGFVREDDILEVRKKQTD